MKARFILISKDNTDHPTIIDTRPISILPAVTKFFELIIFHNLKTLTSIKLMSKYQRGFTKGKSTIDNIKDLLSISKLLKKDKTTKDSPTIVFFDLCKAYDTVLRDLLIKKKLQKFN